MSTLRFKVVTYAEELDAIQTIRRTVFQEEQGVAPELEFDGEDETAQHIVVYRDGQPVGTARLRHLTDRLVKIERVAVLKDYRGYGLGRQIMEKALEVLQGSLEQSSSLQPSLDVEVHAQLAVQAFYEKLGFVPRGEIFYEAGIPHIEMRKSLTSL